MKPPIQISHPGPLPLGALSGKPQASRVLAEGCTALEGAQAPYWLDAGTVLGLYRQGGFIPHDTDLDVAVLDLDAYPIREAMEAAGFVVGREMVVEGKTTQLAYAKDDVVFDLYGFVVSGEEVINHNEHGVLWLPRQLVQPLGHLDFGGRGYPIPHPIEDYLVHRYGADWRTPKTSKGDWVNDCPFLRRWG